MPADRIGCAEFRRTLVPPRVRHRRAARAPGLGLADVLRADQSGRDKPGRSRLGEHRHHPVDARRAEPHRHVGPEAGRPGRVSAASSAPSPRTSPASASRDMLPMSGEDHGQVVDRPQPAPPRRGPLHRRPDLLHRLQPPARTRTRTSTRRVGSIVSKQLGHLSPTLPAYVMIPRMLPGRRLGVPRRRAQAVRDAGRPGATRGAVQAAELPAAGRRDARAGRRPQGAARRTSTRMRRDVDASGQLDAADRSSSRRGTSSPRRRPATPSTSTTSRKLRERVRLHAGVRPEGGEPLRLPELGAAHAAGPAAGRGRACGW